MALGKNPKVEVGLVPIPEPVFYPRWTSSTVRRTDQETPVSTYLPSRYSQATKVSDFDILKFRNIEKTFCFNYILAT